MNNIGKMYNAAGGGQGNMPGQGLSTSGRPIPLTVPGRTESFYRTARGGREASPSRQEALPEAKEAGNSVSAAGEQPRQGLFSGLSLPSLGGLFGGEGVGSIGAALKNALRQIGDDDILLILMIVILLNENKEDDYLVLVILGIILLT